VLDEARRERGDLGVGRAVGLRLWGLVDVDGDVVRGVGFVYMYVHIYSCAYTHILHACIWIYLAALEGAGRAVVLHRLALFFCVCMWRWRGQRDPAAGAEHVHIIHTYINTYISKTDLVVAGVVEGADLVHPLLA
jgi:hypothetical protein